MGIDDANTPAGSDVLHDAVVKETCFPRAALSNDVYVLTAVIAMQTKRGAPAPHYTIA